MSIPFGRVGERPWANKRPLLLEQGLCVVGVGAATTLSRALGYTNRPARQRGDTDSGALDVRRRSCGRHSAIPPPTGARKHRSARRRAMEERHHLAAAHDILGAVE